MKRIAKRRGFAAAALGSAVGVALFYRLAFPEENPFLQLIFLHKPQLFYGIKYAYLITLFTTPYIAFSVLFSLVYIFGTRHAKDAGIVKLPAYAEPAGRDPKLYARAGVMILESDVSYSKSP